MLEEDEIYSSWQILINLSPSFNWKMKTSSWTKTFTCFEVVQIAVENELEVIPVKDEEGDYSGLITLPDTVSAFANITGAQMPGAILVLSMDAKDYSLTEISRLAEAERV